MLKCICRFTTLVTYLAIFVGVYAIWAHPSALAAASPTSSAIWPVKGQLLRLPVIPFPNWKPGHRGLDISAESGTFVRSPVAGEVHWVGTINGIPGLSIRTSSDYRHTLSPVSSALNVGQQVFQGRLIGVVETSNHCGPMACLHWGVKKNGKYFDPRWFMSPLYVRLPPR
jgi:murein DD-endopeptidase MepM/ murein hydrolase activator NlpD